MTANFNEVEWLNKFLNISGLEAEGLERVKNFVFLWNFFEDIAMQRNADMNKIRQLVVQIHRVAPIDGGELVDFVDYFSKRYFDPTGQSPYSLDGLKFRPNQNDQLAKNEVQQVLTKKEQAPDMILKALLFIVYRLRNNFFHGEKQIVHIDKQVDNFLVANSILKLTLEKMKDARMI